MGDGIYVTFQKMKLDCQFLSWHELSRQSGQKNSLVEGLEVQCFVCWNCQHLGCDVLPTADFYFKPRFFSHSARYPHKVERGLHFVEYEKFDLSVGADVTS